MNHQKNSKIITKEEAFLIVKDSVVSILNCDANTLTMKSNFVEDLEADSLDRVNLIIEYEVMLGRNIPIDMVRELQTVGQAVDYIMKLCNEQAS